MTRPDAQRLLESLRSARQAVQAQYQRQIYEAANPAQQAAIAIAMKKAGQKPKSEGVAEARGKDQDQFGGMHQDDFQEKLMRLKQLAQAGPMKTVYDPNKRVYKNMPTAVQPPRPPKK